jgi:serine/threonine protein kinase
MALAAGTRFGPYQVAESIGSGGMGEVYRATDTNLKREVAIKILPQAFADDADRVARFQREAEALAALNHPNIAQIHGLERSDGNTALVMEFVEGPTLADRIAQGPISYDEALSIAMQVADALEAAHGRSIVHRDLKRTRTASSIAISSPRTSRCGRTARSRCSTSASRRRRNRRLRRAADARRHFLHRH